ncbi:unnamed protein product [marine sediment metagenome]|uniref:Uncharacterized protein n=1 Tax=marine sediment metagenome TaxID=412755 RepID=X1EXI0_9ZZZZ
MTEQPGEANLLSMMNNIDVDKVGKVLKEFEKYEKILDKVSGITMKLNRIGVLPAILRIAGQKSGVENIDAPLPQQSALSIDAKSPMHLLMFKELNTQPEEVITALYKNAILAGPKPWQGKEKKPKK